MDGDIQVGVTTRKVIFCHQVLKRSINLVYKIQEQYGVGQ